MISLSMNTVAVAQDQTQDLAIVSVTPYPTDVEAGSLVNITVVAGNLGTASESFNVTAYYENNAIETKTILNLAPNTSASLTFIWNTTEIPPGTHTIKAEADPLPQETAIEDNSLISSERVRVFKSPYIGIVPWSTVNPALGPGTNYTISIYTDYAGHDVWGYEFELAFNPNILQGVDVVNGDLITEDVAITLPFVGEFNNTLGMLDLTGNAFHSDPPAPVPVTSGPGILAHVTFSVIASGDSYIALGDETRLIGYDPVIEDDYNIIDWVFPQPGHVLNGYFSNTVEEVVHDMAVISVTASPTEVEAGDLVNITVVIENQGTMREDVTVRVLRDYKPGNPPWVIKDGTKTVNDVSAGAIESLIFAWNTSFIIGNHTIAAEVIPLLGEEDVEDNILQSDEVIKVKPPEEPPIPIDLIVGVVIVAVVAISLVWYAFARRRKRKSKRAPSY